ncbi:MAG: ABC transporter permease [Gaiellaceae bacterium]
MATFVVRRLLWTVVVLFAITVLTFLIFFATPGIDPAAAMAGRNPDPATVTAIRHDFGLDRPLPVRYALLMKHLFVDRDLVSYTNRGTRVIPEIVQAAPVTLSLVFGAALIWVVVSISVALIAVLLKGTILDPLIMGIALLGISIPVFWLGEVINLVTQSRFHDFVLFRWIPPLGYSPLTQDPGLWFKHMIIPWLVLSFGFIGLYSRVLRSSLLDVQNEDFVRTARAKGLSERRVMIRHVLRMSMISFLSLFGLDFGSLVGGGAVLVEVVFGLPGVGMLIFQSASGLDLPVIMATVVYGAFFIIIANLLVDLGYAGLEPRVRLA